MSKETFKSFARLHPELGSYVVSNNVSWQQLYELYEIYGENSSVWNEYLKRETTKLATKASLTDNPFNDIVSTIKKIDLDSVQKGVNNLQKTIGLLQDIGIGSNKKIPTVPYESRPMYKYFED